jgi:hypothetical protein
VPEAVTGAASSPEKSGAKPAQDYKLESEHAHAAEAKHDELRREPGQTLRSERPTTVQPKTHMLFGRIEELTAGAQTARMDTSGQTLKGVAAESMYSGQLVRSFPSELNGTWGGFLQLQQIQLDPSYYQLDAEEAKQTAELMRPGVQGKVNMTFQNTASGLTLEPAKIFFTAPMTQSRLASQMSQLGSGGMTIPGMGNMANNPGMEPFKAQVFQATLFKPPW